VYDRTGTASLAVQVTNQTGAAVDNATLRVELEDGTAPTEPIEVGALGMGETRTVTADLHWSDPVVARDTDLVVLLIGERYGYPLHDHELATATGPVDEADMVARATAVLPDGRRSVGAPQLAFAVAGGPRQQVLRPVELEQVDLSRDVQREALFGDVRVSRRWVLARASCPLTALGRRSP
jgi:hypothetical protein